MNLEDLKRVVNGQPRQSKVSFSSLPVGSLFKTKSGVYMKVCVGKSGDEKSGRKMIVWPAVSATYAGVLLIPNEGSGLCMGEIYNFETDQVELA